MTSIDIGQYRTRDGRTVEIFETGSFAYGRVTGSKEDDFWCLEDGEYTPEHRSGPHGLDLVALLPPIAGEPDPEYQTRLDRDRVTAEFRVARQPRVPQESVEDLPLFGGPRQHTMFEGDDL